MLGASIPLFWKNARKRRSVNYYAQSHASLILPIITSTHALGNDPLVERERDDVNLVVERRAAGA